MFRSRNNTEFEPETLRDSLERSNNVTAEDFKSLPCCKPTDRLQETIVSEISGDRRSRRRYSVSLEVAYKIVKNGRVCQAGSGKTLDMSGSGIAFATEDLLPAGSPIELSIAWPVLLGDTCPLKLTVTGKVVRSAHSATALRMQKYEFRTKGQGLRALTAAAQVCS